MKRWGIITLLVILLTAGAALAIWQPWENKNDQPPKTDDQYLVIKEWGVRFKLPPDIASDVDYYLHDDTQIVNFGSRRYAAIEPLCGADQVGLKTRLIRFSTESNTKLSQDYFTRDLIATINGYKYYYVPSSVGCNQNGKLNSQQSGEIGTEGIDVFNSLSTLTPI